MAAPKSKKVIKQHKKKSLEAQKNSKKKKPARPQTLADIQREKRTKLLVADEARLKSQLLQGAVDVEAVPDRQEDDGLRPALGPINNQTRRAYMAKLRQAISDADVVIEVIDARDPLGYRSQQVEDEIIQSGKKLVLLLNKCDLIPDTSVIDDWTRHLKKWYPCVAFRSATTSSRSKNATLDYSDFRVTTCPTKMLKSGYEPIGARELMNVLNNYARAEKVVTEPAIDKETDMEETSEPAVKPLLYKKITVAVIGMPNVGKSSVINSLCRNSNKVQTGNEAGITKMVSRVKLSTHIELLDTPGVIITGDENDPGAVIRGCVKVCPCYVVSHTMSFPGLLRRNSGTGGECIESAPINGRTNDEAVWSHNAASSSK
eukprot:Blabericola_migrator_1__11948@NODE_730_length_6703_cov_87_523357_g526_i0_p3_GENE_NODE_730_length_6703_cov_87_523357_g526_i0NODE_730_length_6703_cov_87_523357_g526_i0_p3_ORF_typecomplete_len374_score72_92MMR_HSR1/PF01926_23/5_9MMR_HSR1/PF01926_23/1_7e14FeoB_N/PF02421_18/0_0039FeoB_N/PF02421_18/2_5e10RsgA_GTPase/PF03193_16/0_00062RsgA_GTPase/PF03193_16/1_4e07GTP_EFTU/PF00009_27/2_8e05GTP_EFTU/PF00009_27/0_023AIG1/PF04548_16/2_3e03AIG1/PF04548_16/3_9e05MnmE_helical/PF12631_7/2_8e02MnmE_helical/PF12